MAGTKAGAKKSSCDQQGHMVKHFYATISPGGKNEAA